MSAHVIKKLAKNRPEISRIDDKIEVFGRPGGYFVNTLLPFDVKNYGAVSWIENTNNIEDSIIDSLEQFIQMFGFCGGAPLFSLSGITSALGLLLGGLVVFSFIFVGKIVYRLNDERRMVYWIAIMSLIVTAIEQAYLNHSNHASYWLPIIPFVIAVLFICVSEIDTKVMSELLLEIIIVLIICCSIGTLSNAVERPHRGNQQLHQVAQWLEDKDYCQGFASFWNGAAITEMTNGKVEVWHSRTDEEIPTQYKWLQKKSHLNLPQGQVFVILSETDTPVAKYHIIQDYNARLEYTDGVYRVYIIDDFK